MTDAHRHEWDRPWRGRRRCRRLHCLAVQYQPRGETVWLDQMTLRRFAGKWLPAVSGPRPEDLMTVRVAYPFEWNSYESWDVVFRVRFDFTRIIAGRAGRPDGALSATPVDVMNGWMSSYHEDICLVDHEAAAYYLGRTGRPYEPGDNTNSQIRAVIQQPLPPTRRPVLRPLPDPPGDGR